MYSELFWRNMIFTSNTRHLAPSIFTRLISKSRMTVQRRRDYPQLQNYFLSWNLSGLLCYWNTPSLRTRILHGAKKRGLLQKNAKAVRAVFYIWWSSDIPKEENCMNNAPSGCSQSLLTDPTAPAKIEKITLEGLVSLHEWLSEIERDKTVLKI